MSDPAFVAGSGGFVGSHPLDDSYEVLYLDNFGSGRPRNVEHFLSHPRFTFQAEEDLHQPLTLPPADESYHSASRALPKDFTDFPN